MARAKKIFLPLNLVFADLALQLDGEGTVRYEKEVLSEFCRQNGLDARDALADEGGSEALIVEWYVAARLAGAAPDHAAEKLIWRIAVSTVGVSGSGAVIDSAPVSVSAK